MKTMRRRQAIQAIIPIILVMAAAMTLNTYLTIMGAVSFGIWVWDVWTGPDVVPAKEQSTYSWPARTYKGDDNAPT